MTAIKIGQCKEGRCGALEMCFQSRFQDAVTTSAPFADTARHLEAL